MDKLTKEEEIEKNKCARRAPQSAEAFFSQDRKELKRELPGLVVTFFFLSFGLQGCESKMQ